MSKTPDIFQKIAARDAAAAKAITYKRVKLWQVGACGRHTTRLYPYRQAQKIVARLTRRGVDAYISGSMYVDVAVPAVSSS